MEAGGRVKKGAAGRKGGGPKKKPVSRSVKAGLQYPVGRIGRYLKKGRYSQRVGTGAPVHRSAVLEYLAAEVKKTLSWKDGGSKEDRTTLVNASTTVGFGDVIATKENATPFIEEKKAESNEVLKKVSICCTRLG